VLRGWEFSRGSDAEAVLARTTITSVHPCRARLSFASSGIVRVFLNGRPVGSPGLNEMDIDLKPGPNELLFAIADGRNASRLVARLQPMGPNLGLDDRR